MVVSFNIIKDLKSLMCVMCSKNLGPPPVLTRAGGRGEPVQITGAWPSGIVQISWLLCIFYLIGCKFGLG